MVSMSLALGRRRLASLTLVAVLGAAIAGPAGTTVASSVVDEASLSAAETAMVASLNADRTALGLVPVRVDARLMDIARARSDDMATRHYFSHTQPDGRNVFDIISAQHITWFNAGEIIAWNTNSMDSTVSGANHQWMDSPSHKAIVISKDYNYVGVGLAIEASTGKKLWTAVYLKGPDHTAARATLYTPTVAAGPSATTKSIRLAWTGYDVKLQVLTSGLRGYAVQQRTDGGAWTNVISVTTLRTRTFTVAVGHLYEYRILARDRAGNYGLWATRVIDLR
jgi:uncharacterized protein YkwD